MQFTCGLWYPASATGFEIVVNIFPHSNLTSQFILKPRHRRQFKLYVAWMGIHGNNLPTLLLSQELWTYNWIVSLFYARMVRAMQGWCVRCKDGACDSVHVCVCAWLLNNKGNQLDPSPDLDPPTMSFFYLIPTHSIQLLWPLLTTHYSLLTTHYSLLTTHHSPPIPTWAETVYHSLQQAIVQAATLVSHMSSMLIIGWNHHVAIDMIRLDISASPHQLGPTYRVIRPLILSDRIHILSDQTHVLSDRIHVLRDWVHWLQLPRILELRASQARQYHNVIGYNHLT